MKKSNAILLLLCLFAMKVIAQPMYKAQLPVVEKETFYSIELSYQVLGGVCPDMRDLRVIDDCGKEIAWSLRESAETNYSHEFVPFTTETIAQPRRTDVLITSTGESISSFVLKIKNADVDKEAELLGSNDGARWFAVKDRFRLNRISNSTETNTFLNLSLSLYQTINTTN